jgi:hypothetical protein
MVVFNYHELSKINRQSNQICAAPESSLFGAASREYRFQLVGLIMARIIISLASRASRGKNSSKPYWQRTWDWPTDWPRTGQLASPWPAEPKFTPPIAPIFTPSLPIFTTIPLVYCSS